MVVWAAVVTVAVLAGVFVGVFAVAMGRVNRLLDELLEDDEVAEHLAPHGNVTVLEDYRSTRSRP